MHYFFLDASAGGKRYVVEVGTLLVNHLFKTLPKGRMIVLILTLGEHDNLDRPRYSIPIRGSVRPNREVQPPDQSLHVIFAGSV